MDEMNILKILTGEHIEVLRRANKLEILTKLTQSQLQILAKIPPADIVKAVILFVDEVKEVAEKAVDVLDDGEINGSAHNVISEAISPHRYTVKDAIRLLFCGVNIAIGSALTASSWSLGATFGLPLVIVGVIFFIFFFWDKHVCIEFDTLQEISKNNTAVSIFAAVSLLIIAVGVLGGANIVSAAFRDSEQPSDESSMVSKTNSNSHSSTRDVGRDTISTPPPKAPEPNRSNGTATED